MMKKLVAALLLASPILIHAQDQAEAARIAAGCGPSDVRFSVKTDSKQHPLAQPEAGKALVYVFEDEKEEYGPGIGTAVTTRVGVDGKWTGANHGASYFFFSVDPGEHRLCSNWQSNFEMYSRLGSAMTFTAEAGKVYFFRVELEKRPRHPSALKLEQLDGARGEFMVSNHALSSFHAREVARD
jgi:hypothetical protein